MTGRLDAVDLSEDVLLLVLHRADRPLSLDVLRDRAEAVDTTPFVFDAVVEHNEAFIQALRMFEGLGFIEKNGIKADLTERGRFMAAHLENALTSEQAAALEESQATSAEAATSETRALDGVSES